MNLNPMLKNEIFRKYRVTNIHPVIWKRIFLSDPSLYKMVDGVIFYHNRFSMEILTENPRYYKLWECLEKDYGGEVGLYEMGYDEYLHHYIVEVSAPRLLDFIEAVYRMWSEEPSRKEEWLRLYGEGVDYDESGFNSIFHY